MYSNDHAEIWLGGVCHGFSLACQFRGGSMTILPVLRRLDVAAYDCSSMCCNLHACKLTTMAYAGCANIKQSIRTRTHQEMR